MKRIMIMTLSLEVCQTLVIQRQVSYSSPFVRLCHLAFESSICKVVFESLASEDTFKSMLPSATIDLTGGVFGRGGVCGRGWCSHDHQQNWCTNHHNPNFDRHRQRQLKTSLNHLLVLNNSFVVRPFCVLLKFFLDF